MISCRSPFEWSNALLMRYTILLYLELSSPRFSLASCLYNSEVESWFCRMLTLLCSLRLNDFSNFNAVIKSSIESSSLLMEFTLSLSFYVKKSFTYLGLQNPLQLSRYAIRRSHLPPHRKWFGWMILLHPTWRCQFCPPSHIATLLDELLWCG